MHWPDCTENGTAISPFDPGEWRNIWDVKRIILLDRLRCIWGLINMFSFVPVFMQFILLLIDLIQLKTKTRLSSDSDAASLHESPLPQKKLKKGSGKWLLDIRLLLQQEELAASGDLSEDEDAATTQERALSKLSPTSHEWYKCTYDALLQYALGLKQLLNNHKKKDTFVK
ncbi:hypothetical protein EDC04DRAFT_2942170 [Pisolithus marmoratus]|nr:hypothetical protein EDC04DRAFT_2942170 [Pisolithus marmoratus]